jgi:hypothetical protein
MGKDELATLDPDGGFRSTRVIGVLQELGKHVARALDLPEKLMPGCRQFGIGFELVP